MGESMQAEVDKDSNHIANIPHIDGLRAVAVLAVILYHYFPTLIPGGYAGVDVFFVISGYLITGIIIRSIDSGKFSFYQFYVRRICRIFPPLLIVLAFCLGLGYFILHDLEYMALSKHVFATSLFLNNWVLGIESGYFDVSSESKPLLHLWSLSIEEQFYLVWPALIFFMRRFLKDIGQVLFLLAALSLFYGIWITASKPVVGFYGPHARAWELIAGSLAFIYGAQITRCIKQGALLGCLFLGSSLFFYNPKLSYPGYYAMLPVFGAFFLIVSVDGGVVKKLLTNRGVLYIGRLSYSLYLWHWPIICFAVLFFGADLEVWFKIILLGFCFSLSILTKNIFEDKFRNGGAYLKKAVFLILLMATMAFIAYHIYQKDGLPERAFHKNNIALGSGHVKGTKDLIRKGCFVSDAVNCARLTYSEKAEYAIIGDSKGDALFSGIAIATAGRGNWVYIGGNSKDGAPVPNAGLGGIPDRYQAAYHQALHTLHGMPDLKAIIVSVALRSIFDLPVDDSVDGLREVSPDRYQLILADFDKGLNELNRYTERIYFVIDNPTLDHPEKCLTRTTGIEWLDRMQRPVSINCRISLDEHIRRTIVYRNLVADLKKHKEHISGNFEMADFTSRFCIADDESCGVINKGFFYYGRTDHISERASADVAKILLEKLRVDFREGLQKPAQ